MFFDYNYGQYFTLWDKTEGSFEGKGPHSYVKNMTEKECNNLAETDLKAKRYAMENLQRIFPNY